MVPAINQSKTAHLSAYEYLTFVFYRVLFFLTERAPSYFVQKISHFRLKQIISIAKTIPFWTERITETKNFDITDIVPVTKLDFKNTKTNFLNRYISPKYLIKNYTSGSTGIPFIFYRSIEERSEKYALAMRVYRWVGRKHGDSVIRTFASHYPFPPYWDVFPNDNPSDLAWSRFLLYDLMIKNRCTILYSFPSFVIPLAKFWAQDRPKIKVRSIILVGEHLTAAARRHLEDVFSAPVYLGYATREFGIVAMECEYQNGMHIFAESVLLEIINQSTKRLSEDLGEGEIILTSFSNKAMPLIRFHIGDMGKIIVPLCECGRKLSRVEIYGRETAIVFLSDGKVLYLVEIQRTIMEHFGNEIKEFQLYQESLDTLILFIVPIAERIVFLKQNLEKKLFQIFPLVPIKVKIVSSLPYRPGVKRAFFSEVNKEKWS